MQPNFRLWVFTIFKIFKLYWFHWYQTLLNITAERVRKSVLKIGSQRDIRPSRVTSQLWPQTQRAVVVNENQRTGAREKTKRRARIASKGQIPMFQVSSDEMPYSEDEFASYSDYGNVQLGAIAMKPYQDKPRRTMGISRLRPMDLWSQLHPVLSVPTKIKNILPSRAYPNLNELQWLTSWTFTQTLNMYQQA